ncbi:MAG: hypothetical protein GY851_18970 [bacterium]|nr:hypothetical protein [bacterium]
MGFIRHLVPELKFTLTRAFGAIDDRQLAQHIVDLNEEAAGIEALNEFADCRDIQDFSAMTSEGLFRASTLERDQPRTAGSVMCLLVDNPASYGMAKAYATMVSDYRSRTFVSYSLDEALDFMEYSSEDTARLRDLVETTRQSDLATLSAGDASDECRQVRGPE